MLNEVDKKIINELEGKITENPLYLDFLGENTKYYTHGFHSYPAMMIPQIAKEFIELTIKYLPSVKNIYDPFMGSGTTLVEGITHNLHVFGNDVNPLSLLMSKVKTNPIDPMYLENEVRNLKDNINDLFFFYREGSYRIENIPNFDRINFWFKDYVIELLQLVKNCILNVKDEDLRNFYFATFSETVRYVSNTRNSEFKLYRISPEKLDDWNPDVIATFFNFLDRNMQGNASLFSKLEETNNLNPSVVVKQESSMENIEMHTNTMDMLVTSPPYGDSKTTVAYGQFSRLSLQWLDLEINESTKLNQLDNIMLGGKVDKSIDVEKILENLQSKTLDKIYHKIRLVDEKRAREVLQFYIDLDRTIAKITEMMKRGSYQYWVVANRTVKKVNIPTDLIIAELFAKYNVAHLHSFYRNIPNKRMPSRNSPTNKIGDHSVTMTVEIILMLRKM